MVEIRQQLLDSRDTKEICFLSAYGYDLTFETLILAVNDGHVVLANTVPFDYIKDLITCSRFVLQCQKNKFVATSLTNDGVNIMFPYSSTDLIEETREEERFSFRQNHDVVLKILNPFDRETELVKPILDLSASGISIRTRLASGLFRAGVSFDKMEIFRDGSCVKACVGDVVYAKSYIDLHGQKYCQVGIRIKPNP